MASNTKSSPLTPERQDSSQPRLDKGSLTPGVLTEIPGNIFASPTVGSTPLGRLLSPPNFHAEDLQQRFDAEIRGRWKRDEKIKLLETLLERALVTIRALKIENQQLSNDAETYQAAYLQSQDYLDSLLRNCEHFISDPAAFVKLQTIPMVNQEDLKAEWDRANWITYSEANAHLATIEQEIEKKHYINAENEIDNMPLREDTNPFLKIDLRILKSLAMRGQYYPQEALRCAQEAVSICECLRPDEQVVNDVAFINYLAKCKYFYAKCLYQLGTSESISVALQCAAVVDGDADSEDIKTWKDHVLNELRMFGLDDNKTAEGSDRSDQASISTRSDEPDEVLVANTTEFTSSPSRCLNEFTNLVKGTHPPKLQPNLPRAASMSTSPRTLRIQGQFKDGQSTLKLRTTNGSFLENLPRKRHRELSPDDIVRMVSDYYDIDAVLANSMHLSKDTSRAQSIGRVVRSLCNYRHPGGVSENMFDATCVV